jgi:hypothetical protein
VEKLWPSNVSYFFLYLPVVAQSKKYPTAKIRPFWSPLNSRTYLFSVDLEAIEVVLEGSGDLKGHCTVQLKSGHALEGYWQNQRRKGSGIFCPDVSFIWSQSCDRELHTTPAL